MNKSQAVNLVHAMDAHVTNSTVRKMESVNLIGKCKGYDMLVHCWSCGFEYEQTKEWLMDLGYYLPEDQHDLVGKALDIMADLDIGSRQMEKLL